MPLEPGQVVEGRYEVVRTVTRGGMGALCEVRDLRLGGVPRALKEMLEDFPEGEEADLVRRRFEEEARILAGLDHPGIPRVLDYFVLGPRCYVVMEFVRGPDLEQELKDYLALTGRPFPPRRLAEDAVRVLEVLEYLHGRPTPVLHRDVKPANMIREVTSGRLVLVDFGLARHWRPGSRTSQTLVGTLGYCPLEQVQGHAEPRSDLYALGATMHHLLTGKPPGFLDVPPLARVLPEADPDLAAVVDRAVAADPADRFPEAAAMREALERWLRASGARPGGARPAEPADRCAPPARQGPGPALPPEDLPEAGASSPAPEQDPPSRTTPSGPWGRQGAAWGVAAALALLALGVLLGVSLRGAPPEPSSGGAANPVSPAPAALASTPVEASPTAPPAWAEASPDLPVAAAPARTPQAAPPPQAAPSRQIAAAPRLPSPTAPRARTTPRPVAVVSPTPIASPTVQAPYPTAAPRDPATEALRLEPLPGWDREGPFQNGPERTVRFWRGTAGDPDDPQRAIMVMMVDAPPGTGLAQAAQRAVDTARQEGWTLEKQEMAGDVVRILLWQPGARAVRLVALGQAQGSAGPRVLASHLQCDDVPDCARFLDEMEAFVRDARDLRTGSR